MGSSETDTPTKAAKATAAQEPAPAPPPVVTGSTPVPAVYPDWSGFQAYSPIPPHGFFHSPVATSPQAHPYMWGAQHMMPPYGTPPHPYVMYPPGGLYAHPSIPPGSHPFSPYAIPVPNGIAEASGASAGAVEVDGKSSEGKERSPIKRSKGSLGSLNMITGKTNNDLGKPSGASANGVYSQSGESGSDGSSESDAHSQNDSQPKRGDGHDSYDETTQNGNTARASQNGLDRTPSQVMLSQTMPAGVPGGVAGPTTNLNIGMDYWGTSSPAVLPVHGKVPSNVVVGTVIPSGIPVSREHMPSDLWVQDEREIKRQRRKQSNRESARRSRLRKQAECEELAQRVETLKDENTSLRAELERIRKEYDQVLAQNATLKERLDGTSRGAFDTRTGKNYPPSGDDTQKNMNSDGQAGQEDANHIRTIPGHNPD